MDKENKCDEPGCEKGKIMCYGKAAYGWIYCGKCHPEKKYNSIAMREMKK